MIAYSIDAANNFGIFECITVPTGSQEIAAISKGYGADVPFIRPDVLSDDFSTTGDVMAHAVKEQQENFELLSPVCCIYAMAPIYSKRWSI